MAKQLEYLVVQYNDVPDTNFICDCRGRVRLRVSKIEKNRYFEVSRNSLCAVLDNCILVFDEIAHSLGSRHEILRAVFWYRRWLGEQTMLILTADDQNEKQNG